MKSKVKLIRAEKALLPTGWTSNVTITIDTDGFISNVNKDQKLPESEITNVSVLLPSVSNLHSHSFQRAMAGLTEKHGNNKKDDFWTWRDLMYKFLKYLSPEDIFSITSLGQMEMLKSGYSSVSEFHYLHNQANGDKYDNISEISNVIIEASEYTGIGLNLLPVLYEQGGCDGRELIGGQKRFLNTFDQYLKLVSNLEKIIKNNPDFNLGIAAHSMRAVKRESLILAYNLSKSVFHMHIAEQENEIREISSFYGKRPVEWLLNNMDVNERFCLIHCTHMTDTETINLAKTGAIVGLCPVTEANLGDGIFNGKLFFENKGNFGVGTDSNISIDLRDELRMLEYSQRLKMQKRVVISEKNESNGRSLFDKALISGAKAGSRKSGKLEKGYWADCMSIDINKPDLFGASNDEILDKWIFTSQEKLVSNLWSAGRHVIKDGKHMFEEKIIDNYRKTIKGLRNRL